MSRVDARVTLDVARSADLGRGSPRAGSGRQTKAFDMSEPSRGHLALRERTSPTRPTRQTLVPFSVGTRGRSASDPGRNVVDASKLFWKLAAKLTLEDPRVIEGTIMNGRCLRVDGEFLALVDYKNT